MDIIKTLDWINVEPRVETMNEWWREKRVPAELTQARVVRRLKKGSAADSGHDRPISLLNSLYKVFAVIMRGDWRRK